MTKFVLGGKCHNGHALTTKTLRMRKRGSGGYCLRCHADWNKLKRQRENTMETNGQMTMEERAIFSVYKATEGGQSFKDLKESLEAGGVTDVRKAYSPYVGQYGVSVPKKYRDKAEKIIWG
jgi:hypothetical protein